MRGRWAALTCVPSLGLLLGATGCGKGVTSPSPPSGTSTPHQVWEDVSPLKGSGWGEVLAIGTEEGALVAGGDFIPSGIGSGTSIFRGDGSSWSVMRPDFNSQVEALTTYGGALIAGGGFTGANNLPAPLDHVALRDGTTWRPLGGGTDRTVTALVEFGGRLIAAGTFQTAGDTTANFIAAFAARGGAGSAAA